MRWQRQGVSVEGLTSSLARAAVGDHGVPESLAQRARRITLRNLGHLGPDLDVAGTERVRRYYEAVVRRSSVRGAEPGVREYRARAIEASLLADLLAAGMDESRALREVRVCMAPATGVARESARRAG